MKQIIIDCFPKRYKRLLIVCIILAVVAVLCWHLFMPVPLSADEAHVTIEKNDGIIYVMCNLVEEGMTEESWISPTPLKYDFENNFIYYDIYLSFSVTRWSRIFNKGSCKASWRIYTSGEQVDSEGYSTICDDRGIPHDMRYRYGRIFYWNYGGKELLLWDGGFYK